MFWTILLGGLMVCVFVRYLTQPTIAATTHGICSLARFQNGVSNILAVCSLDGSADIKVIHKHLKKYMFDDLPKFRSDISPSTYKWEECKEDRFEKHMKVFKTNACTEEDADQALERYMADIAFKPYSPRTSKWEVHAVTHSSFDRMDMVFKIDHILGDGLTLMSVFSSMLAPLDKSLRFVDTLKYMPDPKTRKRKRKKTKGSFIAGRLWQALGVLVDIVQCHAVVLLPNCLYGDTRTVLQSPSLFPTEPLRISFSRKGIPLAAIKTMAQKMETEQERMTGSFTHFTVNDVIQSIIAGGLRRYMEDAHDPAVQQQRSPKMSCFMIVNLRPFHSPACVEKIYKSYQRDLQYRGNCFSYIVTQLQTIGGGPRARLIATHEHIQKLKTRATHIIVLALIYVLRFVGGGLALALAGFSSQAKCSGYVSNVPGPQKVVTLAGYPLLRAFNVVTPAYLSNGISVLSYAKEVRICIAARVPDPEKLVADCHKEMYELALTLG